MKEPQFNFDLERIKASIESGIVSFPWGLRGQQRRQFMRDTHMPINLYHGYTAHEMARGLAFG